MIRTCTRLIRFGLKVPRVDFTAVQYKKHHKIDFYPVVGFRERKLGACVLNQPANQNLLTEQFLDELYRFLLSYQYDDAVENVWIQSRDVFCHGVDYKELSESKHYLDKMARLAILLAGFNKPTLAQVMGGVKGAGAYLLSMLAMPMTYPNTFMKLDEVSRGMVPVMGGSHRLARMPLRLGYYLALVGDEFNAEEMAQVGLLRGAVCEGVSNSEIRRKFHETNLYFREKFRYMDFDEDDSKLEVEQQEHLKLQKDKYSSELKYRQGELMAQSPRNVNVRFAANQHLVTKVDFQNARNPFSSFSEAESGRTINNYYAMRLDQPLKYLEDHKLVTSFKIDGVQLKRLDLARIDHIFGKDSLGEILQALKEEKSEWADRAYRRITESDPLAALLTFQLIKRAETLPWIACLEQQFSVARRLVEMSELQLRTFDKSSHYVFVNEYSGRSVKQIDPSVVEGFFGVAEGDYKLQHNVQPFALLPVCDYFRDVPDSIRAYLNRTEFVDKHVSEQPPQVFRFLKGHRINYNSRVFDVDLLRRAVYDKLEAEKEILRIKRRLGYLADDDRSLEVYRGRREEYLKSMQEADLEKMVDGVLKDVFKEKFQRRFEDFQVKTASMLGLQKKIQFFKGVKDIILNNLLQKGYEYERKKTNHAQFNGPIYFDPKGKDIYSTINPHLLQDKGLKQLAQDLTTGTTISESFNEIEAQPLPKFFGTPDEVMGFQGQNKAMWQRIKFLYDQKPELWAQAYTYKQLILQASRTSEQLAGYLQWTFQNFYDLLNNSERSRQTYGEFAVDMVGEVVKMRAQKMQKLGEVEQERKALVQRGVFSRLYELKGEEKVRQVFPFYFSEGAVAVQFKRPFMSVLDSTLRQFTAMYLERGRSKLLVAEELGVLDRWINRDLTAEYSDFLRYDVEYVSSYLMILFVKDMLAEMARLKTHGREAAEAVEMMLRRFNVDFSSKGQVGLEVVNKSIITFLYFLVDMHTNAKKHIKSPQSKLIDFIHRLKVHYEFDDAHSLPYSFEGLLLLIGKDRQKVFDRALGHEYIAQPEFLLEYITRESKKKSEDVQLVDEMVPEVLQTSLRRQFDQHYSFRRRTKRLVQNFYYYMMEFERHIHCICGEKSFIPEGFVDNSDPEELRFIQGVIGSQSDQAWLWAEVRAVVEQLLAQRQEVEKSLTKGELYLYDQELAQQLEPENVRKLVSSKLTEEVFLVKNIFSDRRDYDFMANEEELSDLQYTRAKRTVKNPEALKKLNNLGISNEIFLAYMEKKQNDDTLLPEERRFFQGERQFFKKDGYGTRLPFKTYHRMTRDVFVYPEDMIGMPSTEREINLFKKTNMKFAKSLAGEKINLSTFTEDYKQLSSVQKEAVLTEMVDKIRRVESL